MKKAKQATPDNPTNGQEAAGKAAPPPAGGLAQWRVSTGIAVTGFIVDHATKYWAEAALKPVWWGKVMPTAEMFADAPAIQVVPGCLRLVYAENLGAAFSLFYGYPTALGFVSLAASVMLFLFWRSLPADETWGRVAVALVFSGAIGNMVDRLFRGFVVDFIDAYIGQHHWPTFNIADSCICVGVGILIFRFIKGKI